jgi:peroxiredoxin Q/BCP
MKQFFADNIWLIVMLAWGFPLTIYRSRFRKLVYQTESWTINIKPVFLKEMKALFGNYYPENRNYLKFRNFYRFYLVVYIILIILYSITNQQESMKKLEIGDKLPVFSLQDQNGQLFDSKSLLGKKNLVLFFYPKDDTPGCTKEACSFRDQFEVFKEFDAEVIGISGQSVDSHKKFAEKHQLTYTLLTDTENKLRKQFGVPTNLFGLLPGRVTYITNKNGEIIHIFNSQMQAEKHVDEALKILKSLK